MELVPTVLVGSILEVEAPQPPNVSVDSWLFNRDFGRPITDFLYGPGVKRNFDVGR